MSKVNPVNPRSPKYRYQQVASDLDARVASGEFPRRLPGERALADEYGVSYHTVRHGIGVLRDRGIVFTRQGLGSFVTAAFDSDGNCLVTADGDEDEEAEDGSGG